MRCTEATLKALGIPGKSPIHGTGVLQEITKAGLHYRFVDANCSLSDFMKSNQAGKFYLATNGHAMALVDGVLTDTAQGTGKRKVLFAALIYQGSNHEK